jgi:hypothetical protein
MPLEVVSGQFFGLPLALLQSMMAAYTQALIDVATAGQSHAVSGRSFTLANQAEIRRTIQELQAAINQSGGTRVRRTYANFGGYTR